jgi:hypothetical protein
MTKTFLLMDKNKNFEHYECKYFPFISIYIFIIPLFFLAINSTKGNSPMHQILSNTTEEDELEKEIDHLERRLASAKSQLIFITSQKNKQLKS